MPMVDWGKCSAAVLEKDFWRERMRSALEDSRGCCWVLEAVWTVVSLRKGSFRDASGAAYLRGMLDLERRLARRVEVAVVAQRIVLAHNDLFPHHQHTIQTHQDPQSIPPRCFQAASQSHTAVHCTS